MKFDREIAKQYWTKYKGVRNAMFAVLGLMFILGVGTRLVAQMANILTRAAPAGNVSIKDSLIVGQTVLAAADGKEQIKVFVFLQDVDGKPVAAKPVTIIGLPGAEGKTVATSLEGQAMFAGVSSSSGQFVVEATTGGQKLPGKVTVTFR